MLEGGAGTDVLRGGAGFDRLAGGAGADRFEFDRNQNWNRIEDFSIADGDVVLGFGSIGTQVRLVGVTTLDGLEDGLLLV